MARMAGCPSVSLQYPILGMPMRMTRHFPSTIGGHPASPAGMDASNVGLPFGCFSSDFPAVQGFREHELGIREIKELEAAHTRKKALPK